jgi:hypothetical protein
VVRRTGAGTVSPLAQVSTVRASRSTVAGCATIRRVTALTRREAASGRHRACEAARWGPPTVERTTVEGIGPRPGPQDICGGDPGLGRRDVRLERRDARVGAALQCESAVGETRSMLLFSASSSAANLRMPAERATAATCSSSNVPTPRPCASSATRHATSPVPGSVTSQLRTPTTAPLMTAIRTISRWFWAAFPEMHDVRVRGAPVEAEEPEAHRLVTDLVVHGGHPRASSGRTRPDGRDRAVRQQHVQGPVPAGSAPRAASPAAHVVVPSPPRNPGVPQAGTRYPGIEMALARVIHEFASSVSSTGSDPTTSSGPGPRPSSLPTQGTPDLRPGRAGVFEVAQGSSSGPPGTRRGEVGPREDAGSRDDGRPPAAGVAARVVTGTSAARMEGCPQPSTRRTGIR